MSELLRWSPENEDDEPNMHLVLPDDHEVDMDRTNSRLVTFLGALSVYNYIAYDEMAEEPSYPAFRIFSITDGFEIMRDYMMKSGYHMDLNRPFVDPTTQEMYFNAVSGDLDEELKGL